MSAAAARIRANRGLPQKLHFGPPSPELVLPIVTGTAPSCARWTRQPVTV